MFLKAVSASGPFPKDATTVSRRIAVLWFGFFQGLSTVLELHVADGHTAGDAWAGRVAQLVSHDLVSLHVGLSDYFIMSSSGVMPGQLHVQKYSLQITFFILQ